MTKMKKFKKDDYTYLRTDIPEFSLEEYGKRFGLKQHSAECPAAILLTYMTNNHATLNMDALDTCLLSLQPKGKLLKMSISNFTSRGLVKL